MSFRFCGVRIEVKFLFVAVLAVLLVVDRTGVVLCAFLSSAAHELAHLLAMLLFKGDVISVSFEAFGVRIVKTDTLLLHEEIITLLAGPLVNIFLFFLCQSSALPVVSLIAAVNLTIGVFNLLPVGSLDGGRVVSLLCTHFWGAKTGGVVALVVSLVVLVPLFILGIMLLVVTRSNFSLLVVSLFLLAGLLLNFKPKQRRIML